MRLVAYTFLLLFSVTVSAQQPTVNSVKVIKSDRMIYLLSGETVVKKFPVTFGTNHQGHKQQEGDKRTPEGKYILDYKKSDSAFYKAIHISYPNKADLESAKKRGVNPGGAIMIHGQKNGLGWLSFVSQRINWTDGCIALTNSDMEEVWQLVSVPIPIEIVP